MAKPSKEFVSIFEAVNSPKNSIVSVIGYVKRIRPPFKTARDWSCEIYLADTEYQASRGPSIPQGCSVRFFSPSSELLPPIKQLGSIVVCQSVKRVEWGHICCMISTYATRWWLFDRPDDMIFPIEKTAFETWPCQKSEGSVSLPENTWHYCAQLSTILTSDPELDLSSTRQQIRPAESNLGSDFAKPTPATVIDARQRTSQPAREQENITSIPQKLGQGGTRYRFATIENVADKEFRDLIGQVCRIYIGDPHKPVELYFTDYTSNDLLFNYRLEGSKVQVPASGHIFNDDQSTQGGWSGPWGKRVLRVSIWEPHRSFVIENICTGDLICLRNVQIKYDAEFSSMLEGKIRIDQMRPNQIDVIKMNVQDQSPEFVAFLDRKDAYWAQEIKKGRPCPFKQLTRPGRGDGKELGQTLSKSQMRKRRRLDLQKPLVEKQTNPASATNLEDQQAKLRAGILSATMIDNPNIKCAFPDVPTRSIESIQATTVNDNKSPGGNHYTMPFQNIMSRAKIRVVDFYPDDLADFSVSTENGEADDGLLCHYSDEWNAVDKNDKKLWEWRFILLVEDAKSVSNKRRASSRLEVNLIGNDAEHLLDLTATDLRKDKMALQKLTERMFLMWGNLLEWKMDQKMNSKASKDGLQQMSLTSLPFICCLKEYGVIPAAPSGRSSSISDWQRRWRMVQTRISD